MIKTKLSPVRALTAAAALSLGLATSATAEIEREIEDFDFSFEGMFGSYDQMQLQRGLQIFTEICASCHGLKYVTYRTLADEGGPALPADQMRAYAAQHEVFDPLLDDGFGANRVATPSDAFGLSQFPGAPDLSLMAKARAGFEGPYGTGLNQLFYGMGGPEYIASLLSGYEEEPECAADANMEGYYNVAFAVGGYPDSCKIYEEVEVEVEAEDGTISTVIEKREVGYSVPGSWIAMAPPLYGEDVDFADEHSNELESEAADIAAFLMWAAEPGLNHRKTAGLTGVFFLTLLAVLLYITNKRLWAPIKHRKRKDEA